MFAFHEIIILHVIRPIFLFQDAIKTYHEAIDRRPSHYSPQSLFNMLGKQRKNTRHEFHENLSFRHVLFHENLLF